MGVNDKQMAVAINDFTFELFKEIVDAEGTQNIFVSPFSVSYALGMTYNGARQETAESMRDVLKYGELDNKAINEAYKNLMQTLTQIDSEVVFEIANSIWYRKGFKVEETFLDLNRNYFESEVSGLNFADPKSCDIINNWVAESTHDKIEEIISPPIDPQMVMYLINATYFKGTWESEFEKGNTKKEPFYLADGTQIECDMMNQKSDYRFYQDSNYLMIDMPYGSGNYSMAAFLPAEGRSVDNLISTFNAELFRSSRNLASMGEVKLHFPKFKLQYKLKLNDVLSKLGMEIAFVPRKADFSGISSEDTLWIDEVLHKTFVQVDEKGTEAAAVTSVGVMALSAAPQPPFEIRFDRPFIYVIHDKSSGAILFVGKIEKPEWEEG